MKKNPFFLILSCLFYISCMNQTEKVQVAEKNKKKTLTLMVYMAADNDLEPYALSNLRAMERAVLQGMNVLVLLDRAEGYDETYGNWTDTRLFEVIHDEGSANGLKSKRIACPTLGLTASENTELDMAQPSVLKGFIEFCKGSYTAENYALVIWGHGSGWKAFAVDDRTDSYMSVKNLGAAVRGQELSVIGFDTCFGGVLENLYELKDCADYAVACPGVTPSTGWDYKRLLEKLSNLCGEGAREAWNADSRELALAMAESSAVQTGVFDCNRLREVFSAFEAFSQALSDTVTDSQSRSSMLTQLLGIRNYSYTQNPCDLYLDIPSTASFYSSSADAALAEKAELLKQTVEQASLLVGAQRCGIGVHLIPKSSSGALESTHASDYVKDLQRTDQSAFIKESSWWVPTKDRNSESLLDKLFYTVY